MVNEGKRETVLGGINYYCDPKMTCERNNRCGDTNLSDAEQIQRRMTSRDRHAHTAIATGTSRVMFSVISHEMAVTLCTATAETLQYYV